MAEHEAGQRVHAQQPGRRAAHLAHLVDDLVGARHQLVAVAEERLAHLRQPHGARGAVEQRAAEQVFELLHARGDHRLRQAQLARRLGKALRLRHAHEGFDAQEAVHATSVGGAPEVPARLVGSTNCCNASRHDKMPP